jgi:hypothetical protein
MLRELTEEDVEFEAECLEETMHPSNWFDSGDTERDKEDADELLRQLETNPWAWCSVKVTAEWDKYEGSAYLGCCTCKSREDFAETYSGYYADMKAKALCNLNAEVRRAYEKLKSLEVPRVQEP